MCHKGNQTIYRGCWEEFRKITGRNSMSNKDMQVLLAQKGGCLLPLTYDQLDAENRIMAK